MGLYEVEKSETGLHQTPASGCVFIIDTRRYTSIMALSKDIRLFQSIYVSFHIQRPTETQINDVLQYVISFLFFEACMCSLHILLLLKKCVCSFQVCMCSVHIHLVLLKNAYVVYTYIPQKNKKRVQVCIWRFEVRNLFLFFWSMHM